MGCAGASYLGVQNRGSHRAEEGKMPRLTYVWIRKRDILKFMSMPLSNGNFFYSKHFKQWIVLPLSLNYGNCSEALWEAAKVPYFLVPQVSQGGSLREMFLFSPIFHMVHVFLSPFHKKETSICRPSTSAQAPICGAGF